MRLYKYTTLKYIKSCVENGIYASHLDRINDPYEAKGVKYKNNYRVVCLTSSPSKMLMWSYYTNHRGCCIEYDVEEYYALRKVSYNQRLKPHENMSNDEIIDSLYVKGREWKHENEYRIVYHMPSAEQEKWHVDGENVFFKATVKSVSFGVLTDENGDEYLNALEYLSSFKDTINVKKYRLHDTKYRLVLDKQFDLIYELENKKKEISKSGDISPNDELKNKLTTPGMFFERRLVESFPGKKGVVKFDDIVLFLDRMEKLLKHPLMNSGDSPIWLFNGAQALPITRFEVLKDNKCLINNIEMNINTAYLYRTDEGYKSFIYIELGEDIATGLYNYNYNEVLKQMGYVSEEYAIYNGTLIKRSEYDDGFYSINGRIMKIPNEVEKRERFISPYNFIICAKTHSFNSLEGNKLSDKYLRMLMHDKTVFEKFILKSLELPVSRLCEEIEFDSHIS